MSTEAEKLALKDVENMDWDELLAATQRIYNPPASINLPIQPANSPVSINFEPGFVFKRHFIYREAFKDHPASVELMNANSFALAFAFTNNPRIPDWHRTAITLEEGRYPVITARYGYYNGAQVCGYCTRLASGRIALWTEVSFTNESSSVVDAIGIGSDGVEREVEFWARFDYQKEVALLGYKDYIPYRWNAANWLPCDCVSYSKSEICLSGKVVGRVFADDFLIEAVDNFVLDGNKNDGDELLLKKIDHALHAKAKLKDGERKSFTLAIIVECEEATSEDIDELECDRSGAKAAAIDGFKHVEAEAATSLVCTCERWDDVFASMQLQCEQLMIAHPDEEHLIPTQGGVYYRHYMWIWEAKSMLMPLLRTGRFKSVRSAIELILSYQDRGNMPEGRLNNFAGCIGTTAIRWLNTTGSALSLAANYYRYSKDAEFLEAYLPTLLKAADWIINELRHTRVMNPDGSKPNSYGLMPFGRANDGDIGLFPTFTDTYTFKGLNEVASLLEEIGHSRKNEIRSEVVQYHSDLAEVTKVLTRADGYIERVILNPVPEKTNTGFERVAGAAHLFDCGSLSTDSTVGESFIQYFERMMVDGTFLGATYDSDKIYLNGMEKVFHRVYLRRGEWKKAFTIFRSNMIYGMAPETWLIAERFSKCESSYLPFQPNGSGCGRALEMLIDNLYFTYQDNDGQKIAVLCAGLIPAYLKASSKVVLKALHTPEGVVSLEVEYLGAGSVNISLKGNIPDVIRIPDFYEVEIPTGAQAMHSGFFRVNSGTQVVTFTARINYF